MVFVLVGVLLGVFVTQKVCVGVEPNVGVLVEVDVFVFVTVLVGV